MERGGLEDAAQPLLGSRERLGDGHGGLLDEGTAHLMGGGAGSGSGPHGWLSEQLRGSGAGEGLLQESPNDRGVLRLPAGYQQGPPRGPVRMVSARHRDATRAR